MLLNHFKTASILRHWLNCNFSKISEFIFSTSCILTFPSSFFDGFIKRHVGLERKLPLWSLSVTKAGVVAMRSTLSLILSLVNMLFASRLIEYIYNTTEMSGPELAKQTRFNVLSSELYRILWHENFISTWWSHLKNLWLTLSFIRIVLLECNFQGDFP